MVTKSRREPGAASKVRRRTGAVSPVRGGDGGAVLRSACAGAGLARLVAEKARGEEGDEHADGDHAVGTVAALAQRELVLVGGSHALAPEKTDGASFAVRLAQ
jgi:hypothetical protein